ncbi:hypothetical protein BKA64DRAFT_708257 [Cadophora sp. MPI-SDFR-AT-0126]|nr:hypothetical protein BKA64DRAFT_708257 [Leotiomycetes sp. MPI-SDFR-AT-0126]
MSDLLYHIKRTIIRYDKDSSGATRDVDILGTFTDLAAAKDAADVALASEGYLPADFDIYDQKSKFPFEEWKHDDGVMVYAKAPTGPVFEVGLDTEINKGGFKGSKKGEVEVLQTTINYNIDRTGASQFTLVEGTFPTKTLAAAAALTTLLDDEITEESFAEFDVKDNFKGEWPYGEDCLVRAVGPTGENYFVRVKEPLRKGHRCKNGKCGCGDKAGCKQEGCKCPA